MKQADIIVLDFGSQYTQLIARRLRECGIFTQILPFNTPASTLASMDVRGLILSGGPASVYAKDAYFCDEGIFALDIPILGICYGMQLIAHHFGAKVAPALHKEYGKASISLNKKCDLFNNLPDKQGVWMSHSDRVESLPEGFEAIASSENSPFGVFANKAKKIYALQFHPEVKHSDYGTQMLKNFAKYICGCESVWNMGSYAKDQIKQIKEEVGSSKVLCAVSGGVDSSVVAALLHHAIGKQLVAVFVDTGLLRSREKEEVQQMFAHKLNIDLITIDAKKIFLERLKGIKEPEEKRKIIGKTFIELFEEEALRHEGVEFLAQGTLYTDIIESSVAGASKTIKSHHNVGGLPSHMKLKLIEPLREIFKDEVRKLGLELGINKEMVNRHPFPGPGLAIRIMGEVNEHDLKLLQAADAILLEELKSSGWYDKTWQAFCVLLNVRSVGVVGDNRVYDNTICVRVVDASDGMTANFSHLPFTLLENVSKRITNEVKGIARVVYDISNKPPATIEWE